MMGIPSKAKIHIHLETARLALERSHSSKSKRPAWYVAPEISALRAEVSTLRAAVDALLGALDIMALDPAPLEPVAADMSLYSGDEPLGTCPFHGDYWTNDCTRCGR